MAVHALDADIDETAPEANESVLGSIQDKFVNGKPQERYGIAKDQVKKDVDDWFSTQSALLCHSLSRPGGLPGLFFLCWWTRAERSKTAQVVAHIPKIWTCILLAHQ